MKIEKRGIILQFDENTLTYSMEVAKELCAKNDL